MPPPFSGWLTKGVGLGPVEEYLKNKERQRPDGYRRRRGQFRPPGYDIQQCERGPPGPFPPNNEWPGGRPNGYPETCSKGNPWMHHVERMPPLRRSRQQRRPPPTPRPSPALYHGQPFALPGRRRDPRYHDSRFHPNSGARYEDDGDEDEDWGDDGSYSSDGFHDESDDYSLGGRSYERHDPRRHYFDEHRRMRQGHHHDREPYGRYGHSRHPPHDPYSMQRAGYYDGRVPGRYHSDDYRTGMHHDDLMSRGSSTESW